MSTKNISKKNKTVALVLAIFLGPYGAHQFYVGKIGKGILYLFTAGLFGIGWIVDIVRILTNQFTDNNGLFLVGEKKENTETSSLYPEHKKNEAQERLVAINKLFDNLESQSKENTVIKESIELEHNNSEAPVTTENINTNTAKEIKIYNSKHIMPFFYSENDILCYRYDDSVLIASSLTEFVKEHIEENLELLLSDTENTVIVKLNNVELGQIVNRTYYSILTQWQNSNFKYNAYINKLNVDSCDLDIMLGFYRNLSEYEEKEFEVNRVYKESKENALFLQAGSPIHIVEREEILKDPVFVIVDQYDQILAKAPKKCVDFINEDEKYSYGYITELYEDDNYELCGFSFVIYSR